MVWCSEFVQAVEVQVTREDDNVTDVVGKISLMVWCSEFVARCISTGH